MQEKHIDFPFDVSNSTSYESVSGTVQTIPYTGAGLSE